MARSGGNGPNPSVSSNFQIAVNFFLKVVQEWPGYQKLSPWAAGSTQHIFNKNWDLQALVNAK